MGKNERITSWITTAEAAELTGYAVEYVRSLARRKCFSASKRGRDWWIDRDDLLRYKEKMDTLGRQRHNPWRADLAERGRGQDEQTAGGHQ